MLYRIIEIILHAIHTSLGKCFVLENLRVSFDLQTRNKNSHDPCAGKESQSDFSCDWQQPNTLAQYYI